MPYLIDATSLPDVLQVSFVGAVDLPERAKALEASLAFKLPRARILVDFSDATLLPSSWQQADHYAESLALAFASDSEARIAYVTAGDCNGPLTIAVLAALRGFYYRSFASREVALDWLRLDDPVASPFLFPA